MIQFVSGNIDQATEPMLFSSAEILSKLELYLINIFQIRSNTSFKYKYKYKYTKSVFFKYKYKYEYLCIWTNTDTYLNPALHHVISVASIGVASTPGRENARASFCGRLGVWNRTAPD